MSYFTAGGPGKEQGTRRRIWEKSKEDATHPTNLPESSSLESISAEQCVNHQEEQVESQDGWPDNLEPNPITIKPETANHVAEQFSWAL